MRVQCPGHWQMRSHWHYYSRNLNLRLPPSRRRPRVFSSGVTVLQPCAYLAQPYSVTLVPPGFYLPVVGLPVFHKTETADLKTFAPQGRHCRRNREMPGIHE